MYLKGSDVVISGYKVCKVLILLLKKIINLMTLLWEKNQRITTYRGRDLLVVDQEHLLCILQCKILYLLLYACKRYIPTEQKKKLAYLYLTLENLVKWQYALNLFDYTSSF